MNNILLFVLGAIFIYMTFWFFLSLVFKRNDIADIAWGLGFILIAWSLVLKKETVINPAFLIIVILTTLWGLRLAAHIYSRNKNKKEDYRYKEWRDQWGKWFYVRSYFQVFMLQGFFMFLISFSVAAVSASYQKLSFLNYFGLIVWVVGFFFESVGDFQLAKFLKEPKNAGKIMRSGLWKYTRHPNYFGEVAQWWGIYFVAFGAPMWVLAIISPLTITYLILKVSGIPMLEKKYENNLEFQEYKKVTNAFFPWVPKRG